MAAQQQRSIYVAGYGDTVRTNNYVIHGGSRLTVVGDNNIVSSDYSKLYGNGNIVSGSSVEIWGDGNTITSDYAKVEGSHNAVAGSSTKLVGHNNLIAGDYAKAHGNNNIVKGNNVKVDGSNNDVNGEYARVRGDNNAVQGRNASANGSNNRVAGEGARAGGGSNNTVNGIAAEVARQQEQQRFQQEMQIMSQEYHSNPAGNQHLLPLLSMWMQQNHTSNGAMQQSRQQQQIQMNLRGHDERSDGNGDACMLCLDNIPVVASFCCGKKTVCVGCARNLYQGKLVGDEACLNCRGTVHSVARIL